MLLIHIRENDIYVINKQLVRILKGKRNNAQPEPGIVVGMGEN